MCIICVQLDANKLTPWEAAKNRREYLDVLDEEHLEELNNKISDALHGYLKDIGTSTVDTDSD